MSRPAFIKLCPDYNEYVTDVMVGVCDHSRTKQALWMSWSVFVVDFCCFLFSAVYRGRTRFHLKFGSFWIELPIPTAKLPLHRNRTGLLHIWPIHRWRPIKEDVNTLYIWSPVDLKRHRMSLPDNRQLSNAIPWRNTALRTNSGFVVFLCVIISWAHKPSV